MMVEELIDVQDVDLPETKLRILMFIRNNPRCARPQVAAHVYGGGTDGLDVLRHKVVSVHINGINHVLRRHGLHVDSRGGPGSTYTLRKLPSS